MPRKKPAALATKQSLTTKQEAFILAYLANGYNATEAARAAGYSGNYNTLSAIGAENLGKPNIQAAISEHMAKVAMPANEVLARLAAIARFDLSPFIRYVPVLDKEGQVIQGLTEPTIDLKALTDAGYGWAIKTVKPTNAGTVVEFHDSFAALLQIGKVHKLFTDRIEHDGEVGVWNATDWKERQRKRLSNAVETIKEFEEEE